MNRKKTPVEIETEVLVKSARRCTLCFHLAGDLTEKIGQIAHIDKDPSNFAEDNLAFMCLEHHTLFDSKASQHKNYTPAEVKATRKRLHEAVAQKKHIAPRAAPFPNGQVLADNRFFEQRRGLAETAVLQKIWSQAHWKILICPTKFLDARFQDLSHIKDFMQSKAPRSSRFRGFIVSDAVEGDALGAWIAGEVERKFDVGPSLMARWVMFTSGQFAYNRAVMEDESIEKRLNYGEVIWLVTQVFHLAGRMAAEGILSPEATVRFQLLNVAGRSLYTNDFLGQYWSRERDIDVVRRVSPADLQAREGLDLALGVALEIYSRFGWTDAPADKIAEQQTNL